MKLINLPKNDEAYVVKPNEIAISNLDQELITGGMTTCSALIISNESKQLLSHVNAVSDPELMSYLIENNFELSQNLKVNVVLGDGILGSTELSEKKILGALEKLNLMEQATIDNDTYMFYMSDLSIKNGEIAIREEEYVPKDHIILKDGVEYHLYSSFLSEQLDIGEDGTIKYTPPQEEKDKSEFVTDKIYENAIIGPPSKEVPAHKYVGVYIKNPIKDP